MAYLLLIALVGGFLMLLYPNARVSDIGRMLFFAAVLALLFATAPSTVRLLHGL